MARSKYSRTAHCGLGVQCTCWKQDVTARSKLPSGTSRQVLSTASHTFLNLLTAAPKPMRALPMSADCRQQEHNMLNAI